MKLKFSDLWRWEGGLDRGPFALWGALLPWYSRWAQPR